MGNQSTHLHQAAQQQPSSVPPSAEPLDSFMKEKQRDEHLKNLGFKRSKSLRRSISKKLRRNKRKRDGDVPDGGGAGGDGAKESQDDAPKDAGSVPKETKERVPSVEKLDRADVPEAERRPRPAVGDPQPLPSHVSVSRLVGDGKGFVIGLMGLRLIAF